MQNLLNDLQLKNPYLTVPQIEGLLYIIENDKLVTNTQLIQQTGLTKEILKTFKLSISSMLKNTTDESVQLNSQSVDILNSLKLKPYNWTLVQNDLTELAQKINQIRTKYNLQPKRQYDQFFATPQGTAKKVSILNKKGQISNKKILIIGDDDLVSIAIALFSTDYTSITVLDVDKDILNTVNLIAKDLNLPNITTIKYDLRNPIPSTLKDIFDVVITDPPYTASGIKLFLNKGLKLLNVDNTKPLVGKYIFLYFGASIKEMQKFIKIQQIIDGYNLVIEEKLSNYISYNGAESIGSSSSLYVLKTTQNTNSLPDSSLENIYTHENQYDEKFPYVDHYIFKLTKVNREILKSKKQMQKLCGQFLDWHKLNVVDFKITRFKGGGLTITYVLSQSNLNVHTWPELQALHLDLITCSPVEKKQLLGQNLSSLFGTKYIEILKVS